MSEKRKVNGSVYVPLHFAKSFLNRYLYPRNFWALFPKLRSPKNSKNYTEPCLPPITFLKVPPQKTAISAYYLVRVDNMKNTHLSGLFLVDEPDPLPSPPFDDEVESLNAEGRRLPDRRSVPTQRPILFHF